MLNVILLRARDFRSMRTGYSDNPALITAWLNSTDLMPSEELIQHVINLQAGAAEPWEGSIIRDEFADFADYHRSNPGYHTDEKIICLAGILPDVRNIYPVGFNVVEELDAIIT